MQNILLIIFKLLEIVGKFDWKDKAEQTSAALDLLKAKDIEEKKAIVKRLGDAWSDQGDAENITEGVEDVAEKVVSNYSSYGGS